MSAITALKQSQKASIEQASKLAKAIISMEDTPSQLNCPAPFSTMPAGVYCRTSLDTIALASGTTSVLTMYDPELTLRNGQTAATVFERNASNVVTNVQRVLVGTKGSNYASAGVIASELKVSNVSGRDDLSGFMTSGVIVAGPNDIGSMTSNDLSNIITDKEAYYVRASAKEGTITWSGSNDFGARTTDCREGFETDLTAGNFTLNSSNTGLKDGFLKGFANASDPQLSTADVFDTATGNTTASFHTALEGGGVSPVQNAFFDSRRRNTQDNELSDFQKALSYNSYHVKGFLGVNVLVQDEEEVSKVRTTTKGRFEVALLGSDNKVIGSVTVKAIDGVRSSAIVDGNDNSDHQSKKNFVSLQGYFDVRTSEPVKNLAIGFFNDSAVTIGFGGTNEKSSGNNGALQEAHISLTISEQVSSISARPIHISIIEGVDAGQSIAIQCGALIAGVLSSSNLPFQPKPYAASHSSDGVRSLLVAMSNDLPHALIMSEHATLKSSLALLFPDQPMGDEVYGTEAQAMVLAAGFGDFFKGVGSSVKKGARGLSKGLSTALKTGSKVLKTVAPISIVAEDMGIPGAGMLADAVSMGDRAMLYGGEASDILGRIAGN